jgi:hypothetical protein
MASIQQPNLLTLSNTDISDVTITLNYLLIYQKVLTILLYSKVQWTLL